jgi:hypothetical protein
MTNNHDKSYKPKVKPVKLICGVLFNRNFELEKAEDNLTALLGPIDLKSPIFDFVFTDYYGLEMGDNLQKRFYSFERLIMPDTLPDIKNATIAIEGQFSLDGNRAVNLDPGYLEESKLVLASTKNFSHRIYLRDNIWAEVTMRYAHGKFITHDWTYPDYSQDLGIEFLSRVREIYKGQLEKACHCEERSDEAI